MYMGKKNHAQNQFVATRFPGKVRLSLENKGKTCRENCRENAF
jgi:hypothetical protein